MQVSRPLQASPSSHAKGAPATQPLAGSHDSDPVQRSLSSHCRVMPAQTPSVHVSRTVHASPSSGQDLVLLTGWSVQLPVAGSQVATKQVVLSAVLHATTEEVSVTQLPTPPISSQRSVPLQRFPSSYVVQSASNVHVHMLAPAAHTPALHASFSVHGLPSLHASVFGVNTQPFAGTQLSVVQEFWSSHAMATPVHVPALQTSPLVQALPSSHDSVFGG